MKFATEKGANEKSCKVLHTGFRLDRIRKGTDG